METLTRALNIIGLIYVVIPLVFLIIVAIYYLFGKKISKENIDKIIDFSKWYLVSVAVVFSAKLVEEGFSERETGLKEMQVYDKYVETILKADNIEARWKLAQYFATVTPTDRLRNRWIAYQDTIQKDYLDFMEYKKKEAELTNKETLSVDEKNNLEFVQRSIASYEGKLIDNASGRWVIVFTGDKNIETSEYERDNLIKAGIEEPRILFRNNSFRIVSHEFSTRQEAGAYLDTYKNKIRKDAYIINLNSWCPRENFNGRFYECE